MEYLIGLVIGMFIGWVLRSYVFWRDRDCADPDHKRRYGSSKN